MAIYWVEAGHGGTDSGTEANPWLTIDQAMAGLVSGDKVWVKASASYTETVAIDIQSVWGTPIVLEGYTSSTGDGGKVTVDGETARASGLVENALAGNTNYVFKNFIFKNHTSHGVDLDDVDRFCWKNCEFTNNVGAGAFVGLLHAFENCKFNDNGDDGCICQGGIFVGCEFKENVGSGIDGSAGTFAIFCTFFGNIGKAMDCGATNDLITLMVNCTVDGNSKDTTDGLYQNPAFRHFGAVVNCIFYDCASGIDFTCGEMFISRNNLLNANTVDYTSGADTYTGEQTGAPAFTDEASQDYSLAAGSPAKDAGFDASTIAGDSSKADIGSRESTILGGLSMPNKRGGKQ